MYDPVLVDALTQHVRREGRRTALVAAHPDDESIMSGGLLLDTPDVLLVTATDGAPADDGHAQRRGFENAAAYRAARRVELAGVRRAANITRFIGLDIPDQQAARNLVMLAKHLFDACAERMIGLILTHAYEGGHPDHDACAFAAFAAAKLMERAGYERPLVLEAPVYYPRSAKPGDIMRQQFLPGETTGMAMPLSGLQQMFKRSLFSTHKSQANVLEDFNTTIERWRVAHPDFSGAPANGLSWLYDLAGLRTQWLTLVRKACDELDIEPS